MNIAIASEGKDMDAQVCPTAGRAPYYLLFENRTLIKTIKNPFTIGGGGAGHGVIQMLSNENMEIIISGKFGDNMRQAISEKGMRGIEIREKTVDEALEEVIADGQ